MSDPQAPDPVRDPARMQLTLERAAAVISRIGAAVKWIAVAAPAAALVAAVGGLLFWWGAASSWLGDSAGKTVVSLVVLALVLGPAAWLLNVRMAMVGLLELPAKIAEIARRRADEALARRAVTVVAQAQAAARDKGPLLRRLRTVRTAVGDLGGVIDGWGTVAQLVSPGFWLLTVAAFLSVPLLVALGLVAALLKLVL